MDFDPIAAIALHSEGLAHAAERNLDAPVEHCPGWTVADLVGHITDVHWFWGTIAAERLDAPPDESRRPAWPADRRIEAMRATARQLVETLRAADQSAPVWTWAPAQHDIAFITRHQVQEAAVHHWDAAHAVGESISIAPLVAADAIEEFLTFSVSSEDDPADPPRPALDGAFSLVCNDLDSSWTVMDATPGTIAWRTGASSVGVRARASDLLLWLYGRVQLESEVDPAVLGRFRQLTFTN